MEKLAKKKCKFGACLFMKNNLECVIEHEKTCIHRTIKCKYFEHGCNFEAEIETVKEHELNCEHGLSEEFASELSLAGAEKEVNSKKKRAREPKVQAKLMSDGLCWKHHKYGDGAHKCDFPSECNWDNDFMLPSTSRGTFERRDNVTLDAERTICKFHGCSFRNKNTLKMKRHEMTQCLYRYLSFQDCHAAVLDGDIDKIRNMIEYGRNKNPADKEGLTPLHAAANNGHMEAVKLILQCVNNRCPRDKIDKTPLQYAIEENHTSVVQLFHSYDEKASV